MDTSALEQALGQVSLRQRVAETVWESARGPIALGNMDEDHLVNCAIYAQNKLEGIEKLGLGFFCNPEYAGKTWTQWLLLFKAELEFRFRESYI